MYMRIALIMVTYVVFFSDQNLFYFVLFKHAKNRFLKLNILEQNKIQLHFKTHTQKSVQSK